ncbi:MAG TPA: B-box zinc finger protein [Terriglobales bacterium]|nr:B-box zinc finger protein [Terriglobales bacterium]
MNCANHPQNPVAAYCRTCGKPLCTSCTRPVMGVIYCETCVAERMGTPPATSPYQAPGTYQASFVAPPPSSGPNPSLAGLLGAIPFGVGAIYNNQYTKGLVHLAIFVFLIVALSSGNLPGYLYPVLGIFMAFFVVYQIIDAVRTARAIQEKQPPPDPFGLTNMFSPGATTEHRNFSSAAVPSGAIVLIGLGVLFLLHNLGYWFLDVGVLWPLILIALGVWLFIRRQECGNRDYRRHSLAGPAILVTIGVISLIDNLHGPGWDRTWPILLLVWGGIKLVERSGHVGGIHPQPPGTMPPTDAPPAQQPPTTVNTEVNNG